MGLYDILENTSLVHPDKDAVVCGHLNLTYFQLKDRVDRLAASFRSEGLKKGDRIAILHKNCHIFLESYFAAAKIGAVLVPINCRLSPEEIDFILDNSQAKQLILELEMCDPELTGKHSELLFSVDDESRPSLIQKKTLNKAKVMNKDTAHLYYTSGTTGKPKGVILTHGNNLEHARAAVHEFSLNRDDVWLHVSPMFHLADAWAVWAVTLAAGTHIMIPSFEPESVLQSIQDNRVTLSNFIPTMLNLLVNSQSIQKFDVSSLRLILSGGAPIAKDVVKKVVRMFGCDYMQTYGMTETSPFLTVSKLYEGMDGLSEEEKLQYKSKTGRPFAGVQLKVVKKSGREVESNEKDVGEIIVKGKTVTPGYWRLPKETSERLVDSWLHTRDLAVVDSLGFITIVDRMDDQILSGGEKVYSIEVEDVLYSHPGILEAAVFGRPDDIWGETVTAVVVPKEEKLDEHDIILYCKKRLASFKAPKKVFFADELPKTGSSKIHKYKIREKYFKV